MLTKSDIDSFITARQKYDESFWRVCELAERVTGTPTSCSVFDRIEPFMEAARLCNASIRPFLGGFVFEYRETQFYYLRKDETAEEVA